jgi:hypothetical protein
MTKRYAIKVGIMLGLMVCLSAFGWAQAGRGKGRLAGTLTDAEGKPIVEARILLEHALGYKAETRSDAKGRWAIAGLGTGQVTVLFQAEGYRPTTARGRIVQLSLNPPLNVILKPVAEMESKGEPGRTPPPPEPKAVLLRLYAVIASRDDLATSIDDEDLERVLEELKSVLSFRSYSKAGSFQLPLREGESRDVQIFSQPPLRCSIDDIRVETDPEGRKKVLFHLVLEQYSPELKRYLGLLDSRTEVFDQGHLVAGVSSFKGSDSLALIVGAEIK